MTLLPVDGKDALPRTSNTRGARVLVAEDNPALRYLMADVLILEGCVVTEAGDGRTMCRAVHLAGLIEYPKDAFDLIVTDVRMPGESGLDALERLRRRGCRTPAIVVTSFPADANRRRVAELGAILLPKPFNLDELRVATDFVLRTHPQASRTAAWPV